MPKRKSYSSRTKGPYNMKKGKKTALKKKYQAVKRKQAVKKMVRTVRRAKSRAIGAMPLLRQPQSTLVKFNHAHTQVYRLNTDLWDGSTSVGAGGDTNPVFPSDGLVIRQNDIYNPMAVAGLPAVHANGFFNVGTQYGKYRVVGSKTVIRVRRMGGFIPLSSGEDAIEPQTEGHDSAEYGPAPQINTITTGPSEVSSYGGLFDPSTADPMLGILIDRSAWQEVNSTIQNAAIDEYKELRQFAHLKGIQWREIKAGPAQKITITHKFSEKSLRKVGSDTDYRQYNTGTFPVTDNGHNTASAGTAPPQVDDMIFKIKPFDKSSAHKQSYNNARFLVTVDQEFICKVFEPKYSASQNN